MNRILTFILISGTVLLPSHSQELSCFTPQGEQGSCKQLSQCPKLRELFIRDRNAVNILRTYLCRNSFNLCCADDLGTRISTNTGFQNSIQDTRRQKLNKVRSLLSGPCGKKPDDERITGGTETKVGEWPWLVSIGTRSNGRFLPFCGGTLITRRHVVTAAHCFLNRDTAGIYARVADHDLRDEFIDGSQHEEFRIVKLKQSDFNLVSLENDIAVFTLDRDVKSSIQPICFIQKHKPNYQGELMHIAGWGKTENSDVSWVPRHAQIPVVNRQSCKLAYSQLERTQGIRITEKQICAGIGGADTCAGDSGGPLMYRNRGENKYYLAGVVSFGPKHCGLGGSPGVYTRVNEYQTWIINVLAE